MYNFYLHTFLFSTDYGPKFYNVRPSSLVGEEGGEDMVETGIDEEVSKYIPPHL